MLYGKGIHYINLNYPVTHLHEQSYQQVSETHFVSNTLEELLDDNNKIRNICYHIYEYTTTKTMF